MEWDTDDTVTCGIFFAHEMEKNTSVVESW